MPQLGETVTEGTITKWYKAVGDQVARDEPLFEVSTDKVDSEVPSPAEGVLTAILVEEGETVDVGVTLAVIGDGVSANGSGSASAPAPPAAAPAPPPPAAPAPAPPPPAASSVGPEPGDVAAAAADRLPASEHTGDPSPAPTPEPPPPASTVQSGEGLVLSPVVRKLLNEHGIDRSTVQGTGLGGRITRADVESAVAAGAQSAPPTRAGDPAPVPSIQGRRPPAPEAPIGGVRGPEGSRDEIVPFTNIRRRTAEHMVRSKATSAHTLMVKEIDYEQVERVRRAHGDRFKAEEGFSLTYLAFAARAAVEALAEFPHLNSSVGDDALIIHHDINLGIAVDLDNEGLIVPVVHNAEELNLRGMARRIRDVADRARTKRLSLDDISGGTFSITNAGPFGTLITGAIINQPQVAILSTDGVARKPVVVELPDGTESIAIHSVGLVAMTFDHRAVDGAYVARYLARLSEILNDRDWAGEL
ncbi:MAG: dihydrolipoamide acetyltransferase family protein [Acidimicrobiales bacterium]|jgi:2-oxoglutarate dehydrogenase E2 component (dihydrolipoamide succinyltransferase)